MSDDYMCPDGLYAAFNVKTIHTSKHYILFPSNNTQTTHNSKEVTSQNPYKTKQKLHFRLNTSEFFVNQMGR